jgi:hypothetical protein
MHTVKDFILTGRESWIKTHCGIYQVSYIQWPQDNPWAVTPLANGGVGASWCVCQQTTLYSTKEEAQGYIVTASLEGARS